MKTFAKFLLFILLACSHLQVFTQSELLQSGPMVGYTDMVEALLWVQTNEAAEVLFTYNPVGEPNEIYRTQFINTNEKEAYIAKFVLQGLKPDTRYSYQLYINQELVNFPYATFFETQKIWRWRGDEPEFSFLSASCAYVNETAFDRPGKPYGGDYQVFQNMASHPTNFTLWLGDNVYLREPDWNTRSGILHRYTHTRSLPEMQELLATRGNYAIWDDHDFGPNDSDKGFYNKNMTLEAFELFWGNPTYGVGDIKGAITSFQYGDIDFFLLDNRWYRDPDKIQKEDKTILGEAQLEWLFDNLVTSEANFKVVAMGGQFLSDANQYEIYSANGFNDERLKIIRFIQDQNIKNVVFITGDVHFSEASVLREEGKPTIWDITLSTMSSGPNRNGDQWKNSYRIPGKIFTDRNFGLIKVTGAGKDRRMEVGCFSKDNTLEWEVSIPKE